MKIDPGTRLGAYEVLAEIGAGGMGQVYRARDTRLGRDVALKIVQPDLAHDPEYIRRFRREAEILASLTHPHVATVHQLEETDAFCYLVMELVPGETLLERLAHGRLTIRETLRIATQIAAGVEAAHDNGVIHRDLKPANIKITPEGVVKVLDFGIAKAVRGPGSVTGMATAGTHEGIVLGTAAYMSPEQARGHKVDRRSDIWAFGCVLFEMLANRMAFAGQTTSDTIANILEREPKWELLPAATPASIRQLLKRCLEKDLPRRLRDIGDARLEIEEALTEAVAPAKTGVQASFGRRTIGRALAVFAIGGAIGALAVFSVMQRTPLPAASVVQFTVPLPAGAQLANLDFPAIAISPNGSQIAYVATRGGRPQLFIRPVDSLEAKPLPQTEDAIGPFFSPDSRWIGFFSGGSLKKVPVDGGAAVTICEAPIGFGASWGPGDVIVFAAGGGSSLSRVSAAGGTPTRATTLDVQAGEFSHRWPELLPDGETVLFTAGKIGSWDDAQIVAQSLSSGNRRVLVEGGTSPRYIASGYLVYAHGGSLLAVPFDATRLEVKGPPIPVLNDLLQSFDGAVQFSVSAPGHVAYVAGRFGAADRQLVTVDRSGAVTPLAARAQAYVGPRVSPDGQRVIVTIAGSSDSLWLYDIAQGTLTQLAFDASNAFPVWAPDGRRVAFSSNRAGAHNLFWMELGNASTAERPAPSEFAQVPGAWSRDGSVLAFVEQHPNTGRDIWTLSTAGDRRSQPLFANSFDESAPQFSPDGRLIAYVSNESGRNEIYLQSYPTPGRLQQVSSDGGTEPVWNPSGRELFYRTGDQMMGVAVDVAAARVSSPKTIFRGSFGPGSLDFANYDVTPDGQRFVLVREIERSAPRELHVVLHWLQSLASAVSRER